MIKHRLRRLESFLNDCQLRLHKPPPRRLQTVQDVIDLLQEQVEAVRADRWSSAIAKARAIAQLASVARRAIEAGVLQARVDLLEAVLKERKAERRHEHP
jgi:hypothetical protein